MIICEHLDLESKALKHSHYHWLPDGTEVGYLCEYCAIDAGFCPCCGNFVGEGAKHLAEYGACHECVLENADVGDEP